MAVSWRRDLGILYKHKPVFRLILFSITSCIALWFLYTAGHSSRYGHVYPPPQPQHLHHPHYRPKPNLITDPGAGATSSTMWAGRAEEVRRAYLHAYKGYMKYAQGHDELLPVTKGYIDNFNGWSVTLVDSLDTMWIMGLNDEFEETVTIISNLNFTSKAKLYAPFFETVIRYLGGLLSAYALSEEGVLLQKADELGTMLLPVFNTESGLPMFSVNPATGATRGGWSSSMPWSEGLTCQMEYKYLAHLTGKTEYYDKVERVMTLMRDANVKNGLFPSLWDRVTGKPASNHLTVGASADSGYEYLLKQYLLTGKSEPKARDMYIKAANGIIDNLLYLSPSRNLLYVTDVRGKSPSHLLEHLSCFLPGLFALGAHSLSPSELSPDMRRLHQWAAEGLANTCWISYHDSPTGLGPDVVNFPTESVRWVNALQTWDGEGLPPGVGDAEQKLNDHEYGYRSSVHLLRPETVETFYTMWRTTGDPKWRERGWSVFTAIEREAKTKTGYASVKSVGKSPSELINEMPSFFMAETLKYLYLLFTDEEIIPLDRWVFNTEAHPLPIFHWSKWQMEAQGIQTTSIEVI